MARGTGPEGAPPTVAKPGVLGRMGRVLGDALGLGPGLAARTVAGEIARTVGTRGRGRAGQPRVLALGLGLGRDLSRAGCDVVASIDPRRRGRRRKRDPPAARCDPAHLPFADGSFDAVCVADLDLLGAGPGLHGGLPTRAAAAVAALLGVVRDGGWVGVLTPASALARRVAPEALSECLLRARLCDLEQQEVGGALLSSGRVRRYPAPA